MLAPKNVGHNLRDTSRNVQFRPTALLKQISEGVNGSSLSFCCRLHSPWFCFSAALFVVAPFADLTSRNHFCQFTAIFLTILRSRFWDRQAVRIFGPQPLTPTVRLTAASPGHVVHFAVQPEYGRLIGIFPCSQKVEITLRRNTLHLSRFWLQTFRVAKCGIWASALELCLLLLSFFSLASVVEWATERRDQRHLVPGALFSEACGLQQRERVCRAARKATGKEA